MLESTDVWQLFNDTVRMMNESANVQYSQTVQEINATQAGSMDPSDMGAYNLTMYGMNTVHDIQSAIISPMSHLKAAYDSAVQAQVSVGSLPDPTAQATNAIGSIATTAGNVLPAVNFVYALIFIVIGIAIGGLIFHKK
ncbi:MAG TPA: hypothetical protein VMC84_12245 [Methanocella sp.]|uniref:hypothetical protein n=1 Tax=Methanocella sp. TaxID=2052833 RepID=UPI002B785459|nr:hypothetical protein [Methanocella sp.]HTY91937.1 hypothetical protein [Methanocella sp.]